MFAAVSEAKRTANRRNAQKSTGPKTKEGKEKSSLNATTHGFYCAHTLLPGEDPEKFQCLRDSFLLRLDPRDLFELGLVDQIVICLWKLNRLHAAQNLNDLTTYDTLVK